MKQPIYDDKLQYIVPDPIVEVRGRRFRVSAQLHIKTSISRVVLTHVVYSEIVQFTLGVKHDAKVLTALYLGVTLSTVYKQLSLFNRWKREEKIDEIS